MSNFDLHRLDEASLDDLLILLRDPRIARHMPLHDASITREWVQGWVESKMSQWKHPSAGPWAVSRGSRLIGWGGYQPDGESVELALVLAPSAWGLGREIFEEIDRRWQEVGDGRPRVMYLPKSRRADLIAEKFGLRVTGNTRFGDAEFCVLALGD